MISWPLGVKNTHTVSRWTRTAITVGLLATLPGCASLTPRLESANGRLPPGADGHTVVEVATRYLGTPYVWGGTGPAGFDCSGFVRYVYGRHGIALPRTVKDQYRVGVPVSRDRLRPGDIVFFDHLRHNGLYIGNAHLIHASTVDGVVKIARLDDDWFRHRWVGARRPL